MRFLLVLIGLFAAALGQAQCDLPADAEEIDIADFGTLRLGALDTDGETILLSGGVCVMGVSGWELFTDSASVLILEGEPDETGEPQADYEIEAGALTLQLGELTLSADALKATQGLLRLPELRFRTPDFRGSASEGRYDLDTGVTTLLKPIAQGRSFRLLGATATLEADVLTFSDAVATTCVCEGEAFYALTAGFATYRISERTLDLQEGRLRLSGWDIGLGDLSIDEETFDDVAFPLNIEYVGDSGGTPGTGLGLGLNPIDVGQDLTLELGLRGLDNDYALGGVLLSRYRAAGVSFDFGFAPRGVQADFTLTESLTPWLNASFGIRNQPWEAADFLHEGFLGLSATKAIPTVGASSLSFNANVLAAGSSQNLPREPIADARLGVGAGLDYSTPFGIGTFRLQTALESTYYPGVNRAQYGLTLNPSYRYSQNGLTANLGFSKRFTNAASPFTSELDRLSERSQLETALSYATQLAPSWQLELGSLLRYDFLEAYNTNLPGLERLEASAVLRYDAPEFSVVPYVNVDLAELLNDELATARPAKLGLGADLSTPDWELGLGLELDPQMFALTSLETRASFPLHFESFSVQPFVALDFMPSLSATPEWPIVSGHGLELTLPSCCGTLVAGYRQLDNRFTTSFALEFEEFSLGE